MFRPISRRTTFPIPLPLPALSRILLRAKYFVIHDTSTPNYRDKPFPADINDPAWRFNDLDLASKGKVAHFFVNRAGDS